jgi:hypothetical protein
MATATGVTLKDCLIFETLHILSEYDSFYQHPHPSKVHVISH